MTSLKGFLPPAGSALWRKDRGRLTSDSDSASSPAIKHVVIREVWQRSYPSPHALYKIDVMTKSNHWFVFRRYREFNELHKKLVSLYGIPKDMLPPKKLISNMALCVIEKRKAALEHYLQRLVNSSTYVSSSPEIVEFLEVQRHDVMSVTKALAKDLCRNGQEMLAKGESFTLAPTQLYCITRQLQLPEPTNAVDDVDAVDLGNLYDFIYQLKSLCVSSIVSKASVSQELSSHLEFDISLFKSLSCLIIDGCPLTLINNLSKVQAQITNLTARYCLTTLKELLVDCAAEKRLAPKIKGPVESWRGLTTARLMQNRVVVQPWCQLTNLNVTHNKLAVFDTSLKLLPVLQTLDMSHNEFVHLDLQQLRCPSLKYLNLSHNNIHFITGMPRELAHLKSLILSHNNLETVSGLDCLSGLIELNLGHNQIRVVHEISKLCLISHLKYLSVFGNPFARVKPYRIVVLSYFKGKELILDKRPLTQKERIKLRSYPIKLRASTSPDYLLGDSNMSEDVLPGRSHSFNLFGPPESDDDSGIEGAPSIRSNSMFIDPDEVEIADKDLLFNWSYYREEDELLSSNIQRLTFEDNQESQMEAAATSDLHIDRRESKTVEGRVRECLQIDHDTTLKDGSTLMGTASYLEVEKTTEQCIPTIPSHDPNTSTELTGYKEQLLTISPWSPGDDNVCLTQHYFNGKSTSAKDEISWREVKPEACEHTESRSLHCESTGCSEQIDHASINSAEQFLNEGVTVSPSDGHDSDESATILPNIVDQSSVIHSENRADSPSEE